MTLQSIQYWKLEQSFLFFYWKFSLEVWSSKKRENHNWDTEVWHKVLALFLGAGMAHWWACSPLTNVTRVPLSDPAWVGSLVCCWFSALSRGFFSGFSGFPSSTKTNTSKFQFGNSEGHRFVSRETVKCNRRKISWFIYLNQRNQESGLGKRKSGTEKRITRIKNREYGIANGNLKSWLIWDRGFRNWEFGAEDWESGISNREFRMIYFGNEKLGSGIWDPRLVMGERRAKSGGEGLWIKELYRLYCLYGSVYKGNEIGNPEAKIEELGAPDWKLAEIENRI